MRKLLAGQASLDLSYPSVGATAKIPPPGYDSGHTRIKLGKGKKLFAAAKAALERWEHFRLGWVEACPPGIPIQVGQVMAVVARNLGLWWLNAARIVYVVDEDGPVRRFGFAYGTLPDHAVSGEERFLVEWDRHEGGVWYDLLAFSQPRHLLVRLGYPSMRRVQNRPSWESAATMCRAVHSALSALGMQIARPPERSGRK